MATKSAAEKKTYFAYVRYLQSIAVLRQLKVKARNSKEKKEAIMQQFSELVPKSLEQAKELIWQGVCLKKLSAYKGDLEIMNGSIETFAASLREQDKKVAEAGYLALRTVKPIDKETLNLKLRALVEQTGRANQLYHDRAWMEVLPSLQRLPQDLKRIEDLKEEIAENCHCVEFLRSVQPLLRDDCSDSEHSSGQELESIDISQSKE